ncbi:aldo/keto reductase [Piscinibacter gummiphilus]|uniref:Aldo/keto reductase n=1 Tax=Piscinibacter gummiphilus TaxID=946333 RepID=A0A1W6LF49_9BURK|nr:aldo/keto reductase [Piscinibacter gummiphilus]ARN22885.1 aldo/keto reductase [Piscinibacter gummiphilus]ATU67583.1 aldo/keto reductase [Piscinibacter gummiphilus]GLS96704.1 hypothetical protein GCM10007918_39960 [Piscinibacter gummiphilus]
MRTVSLRSGARVPALGLGTWGLGEDPGRRPADVRAVRSALDLGYRLIDTAEMYGEGGAEEVVGQALAEAIRTGVLAREDVFVVTKVYPHNASRRGTVEACERSLRRLGLDHVDLYLLHWPGQHPLAHTVAAMRELVGAGRVSHWGVSNFDVDDLRELEEVGGDGPACATNQVYFSMTERGPEFSLLPWLRDRRMPLMAYSPIDQGALAQDDAVAAVAERHGVSAAQVALAWVLSREGAFAIPKAAKEAHQRENLAAASLVLTEDDLADLDEAHPAPRRKQPLAML